MAIKYTEEQLNSVDKSMLIHMFLNQQEQLEKVSADLHSLDTKMQAMMEQLILANKNRFGRSSENCTDSHFLNRILRSIYGKHIKIVLIFENLLTQN